MQLCEMEERRKQLGFTYAQIAMMTDLEEEEVRRILNSEVIHVSYETVRALEWILDKGLGQNVIRESNIAPWLTEDRKRQGHYTIADYFALPKQCDVELINGVFISRTAPNADHQFVVSEVSFAIQNYIKNKKGKCRVFAASPDVQVDGTDRTMVKPDIVLLCDRKKIVDGYIQGAPELLIEILSKSTRNVDMVEKLHKYRESGVYEYWMVDLEQERVIVHCFEEQGESIIYGFDTPVSVGIYGGELKIDFREIWKDWETWGG